MQASLALSDPGELQPRVSLPVLVLVSLAHGLALLGGLTMAVAPVPQEMAPLMATLVQTTQATETAALAPHREREASLPKAMVRPAPVAVAPAAAGAVPQAPSGAAAESLPAPLETRAQSVPEAAFSAPRFNAAYLDNPAPVYPALARRLGEEGQVGLRVYVEADGSPGRIEIRSSSGSARLDQAAEQAVRRWRFVPAKRGNEAVAAWVLVPISFNLRG